MRTIGIIVKNNRPQALEHVKSIVPLLQAEHKTVLIENTIEPFDECLRFCARAQVGGMGGEGHVFLTTGNNDAGIAQLDMLGSQSNSAQARTTDLIDRPGRGFLGEAGVDMGLAGGVLPLCRGQNLTQNGLGNFGFVDTGTGGDLL